MLRFEDTGASSKRCEKGNPAVRWVNAKPRASTSRDSRATEQGENVRHSNVYLFAATPVTPLFGLGTRSLHVHSKFDGHTSTRTHPPSRLAGYWSRSKIRYYRTTKNGHPAYEEWPDGISRCPAEAATLCVVIGAGPFSRCEIGDPAVKVGVRKATGLPNGQVARLPNSGGALRIVPSEISRKETLCAHIPIP